MAALDSGVRRRRRGAAGPGPLRLLGHLLEDQRRSARRGSRRRRGLLRGQSGAEIDDAQDGGAVSALLIGLLAAGEIDGALVSKPSADPDEQWKGIATIATTASEIKAASGSFYNQTMALAELDLSRYALPPKPRIAVVGTPCEVQGLRAMQARRWPTGAHRVDAVVLTIALMCTKNFDYEALDPARAARQARRGSGPGVEDGRDPGPHDRRIPRRGVGG